MRPVSVAELWTGAALVLLMMEALTPGFFMACLSLGCFAAAGCAMLGMSYGMQLIAASCVGGVLMFVFRPFMLGITKGHRILGPANMIGKTYTTNAYGRIETGGASWPVYYPDGEKVKHIASVKVIAVHGASVTAERSEEE